MLNERNSIGYETDANLLPVIVKKIGNIASTDIDLKIIKR